LAYPSVTRFGGAAVPPGAPRGRAAPWPVELAGEVRELGAALAAEPDDFVAAGAAFAPETFALPACLVVGFVLCAAALPAVLAAAVDLAAAPAGFGRVAALAGAGSLAAALLVDLTAAFVVAAGLVALACPFAVEEPLALSGPALEAFWVGAEAVFAGAFEATAWTALFAGLALVAARGEASVATPAFLDDSFAVLAAAAFGDAFEAFAFTTAPFLTSAASLFVGTISLSCHGEGDRR